MTPVNKLIRFRGQNFWFLDDGDGLNGALAPLDHCDSAGHVQVFADSYAHVFGGVIRRYGTQIGDVEEFEDVREVTV